MDLPVTQMVYNLLEEKWIPVLYCDGKVDRVGICQALTEARTIRQLAASNPMDRVALLRFLLAVLLWCKEDVKSSLSALDEKSTGIPEDWLAKLRANKAAFNLLGDGKRFYQDELLKGKEPRPIGDLLVEFPGADSINHIRHVVYDGSYGFCPACCAMGILRLSVWAPANRYYPASVNPSSAAYAFIKCKNLLKSIFINIPGINKRVDQAPWLGSEKPNSPGLVDMIAWRPRNLWLNVSSEKGVCVNCSRYGQIITNICNEGGWPTPTTNSQKFAKAVETEFKNIGYSVGGADNASKIVKEVVKMASFIHKYRMKYLREACSQSNPQYQSVNKTPQTDAQEVALLFHQLILKNDERAQKDIKALTKKADKEEQKTLGGEDLRAKKFWDADPHLLVDGEAVSLPGLGADVAVHASQFWRNAFRLQRMQAGRVTAIGPVVNKFTFQDCVSIPLPDASDDVQSRAKLSAACCGELQGLLKQVTQNPQRQHPEIDASFKLLTPSAEAQIRDRLGRSNASTGDNATEDKAFLHKVYAPMVDLAVASVTPGSPLRRHATRDRAHALLNEKIEELVEKMGHMSTAGTPAAVPSKPQRGRKKGSSK